MPSSDDDQRPVSRAGRLRLTRMPSLPPGGTGRPTMDRLTAPPAPPAAPALPAAPSSPTPPHLPVRPAAPPAPAVPATRRPRWILALALVLVAGAGAAVAQRLTAAPEPAGAVATPPPEPDYSWTPPVLDESTAPPPAAVSPPTVAPSSPAPSATTSPTPDGRANPSGANLALRSTATASGVEGDPWLPRYAVDGDTTTRWSSAFTDPGWISLDLGARWQVTTVTLVWERSYGVAYRVDTSTDGRAWKTLWSTTAGTGGTVKIPARDTVARYVRMYGTKRVSEYGYSLLEFQVR
ncbi:discoidin domain-containing protein [Actinoplanes sp. NPDC051851]|uniref:discoidin domain-containing protein n=1 Tax=Actinoplanes sp. NPDC051851 TaxID=3154753 RepID=UPI003424ECD1